MTDIDIKRIKEKVFNKLKYNPIDTWEILYKSVDSTTIRAFRNDFKYHTPLSIYRVWAYEKLFEANSMLFNCNDFEKMHQSYCSDFGDFWEKNEGKTLSPYKIFKVVDLFFKWITLWENLNEDRRLFFVHNVHCPLDAYSLKYLKQKSSILQYEIKDNATMSFIKNNVQYYRYQKEIKKISDEMGITPYIFDEIAWRIGHNLDKPTLKFCSKSKK